ncbi:putative sugar kinase YdjH [bioreactor metagenome]|uniref:Putative sugar kinase YdjH n=1 Tax=bioreactor metagenome TaxID=1076179 RepID=A0A645CV95_9ZZZZ
MDYVCRSKTVEQTKSLILVNPDGNRTFIQYPGTSAEFCFEDINLSLLDQVELLQIGGTFHLPKFDGEGTARLLKLAREKGVITSMDVTKDPSGRWNKIIAPCYPYLDYFLPSIEQAACICGTNNEKKIADFFLGRGVTAVVVKMGSRGCYCKSGSKAFYCGCYTVPVAETTGAGDAFVAGFLTAVGKGYPIEECVQFGTATSAHAIQAFGATAGVPDFGTVCAFMAEHPKPMITQCSD